MKPQTIFDQLFFTTIHITDDKGGMGTGFFYSVPVETGTANFVVTNKHVLEDASSITLRFRLKNPDGSPNLGDAYPVTYTNFGAGHWTGHPDPEVDVAVLSIGTLLDEATKAGKPLYYLNITPELVPTDAQIAEARLCRRCPLRWLPERHVRPGELAPDCSQRYDGFVSPGRLRREASVLDRRVGLSWLER